MAGVNQEALMHDTASVVLAAAQEAGAAAAAVKLTRSRFTDVGFRDDALEKATASTKQELTLRLFIDQRYGVHATSDLRPEAIRDFVAKAAALTRALEPDPERSLPPQELYAQPPAPDLGIYDPPLAASQAPQWVPVAEAMEEVARAAGSAAEPELVSASGGAYAEVSRDYLATSDGFRGFQEETGAFLGCSVTFKDPADPDKRRTGWWWEGFRDQAAAGDPMRRSGIAREAVRRALATLGAKPGPSGRFPVVVENQAAGRLVSYLLGALTGSTIDQKRSYLAESRGQAIAAPLFTLRDDPLLKGGFASRWFDGEGMAARPFDLIAGGVLKDFYLDVYYARKLGLKPTTGRHSNLTLAPSHQLGAEGMTAKVKEGLFITGFLGGNFNSTTGDFSLGVKGTWLKGGKAAFAVEGMNMSGRFQELWNALAAVGNDPYPYSSLRVPSLYFGEVQLSGASLAPGA